MTSIALYIPVGPSFWTWGGFGCLLGTQESTEDATTLWAIVENSFVGCSFRVWRKSISKDVLLVQARGTKVPIHNRHSQASLVGWTSIEAVMS